MRFLQVSDLHLGISKPFITSDDQQGVLDQIITYADGGPDGSMPRPDAIIIAGDIYHRADPSPDTMRVFSAFLTRLHRLGHAPAVFMISGNHDSPTLISYVDGLLQENKVYTSREYDGSPILPIELCDEFGPVDVYLMPFIPIPKFKAVRGIKDKVSPDEALRTIISEMHVDKSKRNVLVAHYFVIDSIPAGSEYYADKFREINAASGDKTAVSELPERGYINAVPKELFSDFDYVALGHIHRPQIVQEKDPLIVYSGSTLPYSFDEAGQKKRAYDILLAEKGKAPEYKERTLSSDFRLLDVEGSFDELLKVAERYGASDRTYFKVALKGNDYPQMAQSRLYDAFNGRILDFSILNEAVEKSSSRSGRKDLSDIKKMEPLELAEDFYLTTEGRDMTDAQREYLRGAIEKIWSDSEGDDR